MGKNGKDNKKNKGPGLTGILRFGRGSKKGEKVQVPDVEEIPEIIDSEKEKHNEEDKGPGLMESKREEKVQVQDAEDGIQVTEEIPKIVDNKQIERKDSLEEEKGTLTEKIRNQEQEKGSEKIEIESLEKLMVEVSKRKDIPEREKESLMEKIWKIEKEKDALLVQIGFEKMKIKSFNKLMEKVSKSKRKDISKEEKESLKKKISEFKQEKESLKELLDSKTWKPDPVQEREETSEIVDKGKDSTKNALQIEVERLQKENNELKVELKWRRARTYADDITLNPDTAHPNLSISEVKKKFIHDPQPQKVPSTPERFDSTVCVLGFEGFSAGKHYWEVDVRSSNDWDLGVARKVIKRTGKLSLSPKEGFWALGWSGRDYWAKTDPWTQVTVKKKPKKIGVYLSYQEGQVTFFNITDMSVLFTFNDCSFSGAVYPFFKNSNKETSMRICSVREDE